MSDSLDIESSLSILNEVIDILTEIDVADFGHTEECCLDSQFRMVDVYRQRGKESHDGAETMVNYLHIGNRVLGRQSERDAKRAQNNHQTLKQGRRGRRRRTGDVIAHRLEGFIVVQVGHRYWDVGRHCWSDDQ